MAEPGSSLNILEVGGGTGTLARDVLDHLRAAVPASYAQCSYTSVEISPQLADVQKRTVSKTAGHGSHHQVQSKTSSSHVVTPPQCMLRANQAPLIRKASALSTYQPAVMCAAIWGQQYLEGPVSRQVHEV